MPAGRITLIELTPHLAVNDAAALVEAQNYAGAIEILDTFIGKNRRNRCPKRSICSVSLRCKLSNLSKNTDFLAELAATLVPDAPASSLEVVVGLR